MIAGAMNDHLAGRPSVAAPQPARLATRRRKPKLDRDAQKAERARVSPQKKTRGTRTNPSRNESTETGPRRRMNLRRGQDFDQLQTACFTLLPSVITLLPQSSRMKFEMTWLTLSRPGSSRFTLPCCRTVGTPLALIAWVLWQVKQLLKLPGDCVNDSIAMLDMRSSPARIEYGLSEPSALIDSPKAV